MTAVTFFVPGIPVPQGSKKAFVVGKRAVIVDVKPELLGAWRGEIARRAFSAFAFGPPIDGAVRVDAAFVLPRKPSVTRPLPIGARDGDVDKLVRALLDGITQAGNVWADDSRVAELHASKVFGPTPGVHVTITPISDVADLVPPVEQAAAAVEEGTAA
ncbi:RusA family crossover junction endodeoxyribonuclease [Microbacterium testaceum]|uniref:RusA family crossover junction endodeoxyribonuclease n=1 Tax=Microbacterium testaceum TaxID=2033 RepID=UPI000734A016|nr:RusA family crossover junction endodeoxyribonuclease [Microbacterium testaceum]